MRGGIFRQNRDLWEAKISTHRKFGVFSKRIMQPEEAWSIAKEDGKDFRVIVALEFCTNADVICESFRIRASASARFCPAGDKSGSLPPPLDFSAWRTMKITGAALAVHTTNDNRGIERTRARCFILKKPDIESVSIKIPGN